MQDNQTINASALNNIAVDLGAGTFSKFTDGEPFAVTELNAITADIVTAGILNSGDKCECVLNSDGSVIVKTGVIVFSDGCKIRIATSRTLTPKYTGVKNYVFAEHSQEFDSVYLKIDNELTENECIVLAEIESGKLTDKRNICTAKCEIPSNNGWNCTQAIEFSETFQTSENNESGEIDVAIDGDDFNYIIFNSSDSSAPSLGIWDIKNGTGTLFYKDDGSLRKETITDGCLHKYSYRSDLRYSYAEMKVKSIEYGKLTLRLFYEYIQYSNNNRNSSNNFKGTLILC